MSVKMAWRSFIFIATLGFLYLAFPILIVPSSAPAIKAIIVDEVAYTPPTSPSFQSSDKADLEIYELQVPEKLDLNGKINALKDLHSEGLQLIFNREIN